MQESCESRIASPPLCRGDRKRARFKRLYWFADHRTPRARRIYVIFAHRKNTEALECAGSMGHTLKRNAAHCNYRPAVCGRRPAGASQPFRSVFLLFPNERAVTPPPKKDGARINLVVCATLATCETLSDEKRCAWVRTSPGARSGRRHRRSMRSRWRPRWAHKVETLRDIPSFSDMRIDDAQRAAFDAFIEQLAQADAPAASEMQLGCVVRLDRGFPLVGDREQHLPRRAFRQFRQGAWRGRAAAACGSDAVAVRVAPGHDMGVIERVLPRRTAFERWRGKKPRRAPGACRQRRHHLYRATPRCLSRHLRARARPHRAFARARLRLRRQTRGRVHQGRPLHPRRAGRNVPRCPTPGGRGRARDRDVVGAGNGPRRGARLHSRRYLRHDFGRIRRGEVDAAQRPVGLRGAGDRRGARARRCRQAHDGRPPSWCRCLLPAALLRMRRACAACRSWATSAALPVHSPRSWRQRTHAASTIARTRTSRDAPCERQSTRVRSTPFAWRRFLALASEMRVSAQSLDPRYQALIPSLLVRAAAWPPAGWIRAR